MPEQVYIFNNLGNLFDFTVNDRRYSIFAGMRQRLGSRDRLDGRAALVGTIRFAEPISLDAAITACWDWRRYFNQMALSILRFTGMSVAATGDDMAKRGNLYLPNEVDKRVEREARQGRGPDAFYMPLNRWEERERAGDAMRNWLLKQDERLIFRAALDRVLARPGHVATEDAVALCAGIDTLPELSTREALPGRALEAMADAALAAARHEGAELDPLRIRGLLGSLQNDDLRRKLRRLAAVAAPESNQEDVERWISVILPLRLLGAHGRRPITDQELVASPAVDGLAALCVRYDQQGAGVPSKCGNGSDSLAVIEWRQALMGLSVFSAN